MPFQFQPELRMDGPDTPSNGERAERGRQALLAHLAAYPFKQYDDVTDDSLIQDLVSDLAHLCDQRGFDFDDLVYFARNNWAAERSDTAPE